MVYVSDFDGNPIHTFGSYGRKLGEFNEPSGITSDADGNLLIADSRNNRIQVNFQNNFVCMNEWIKSLLTK